MYCVLGTLLEAPRRSAFAEGTLTEAKGTTELAGAEVRPALDVVVLADTTGAEEILIVFVVEDGLAAMISEEVEDGSTATTLEGEDGLMSVALLGVEVETTAVVVLTEDGTSAMLVAGEDLMTPVKTSRAEVVMMLETEDNREDVLSTMQE